MRMSMDGIEVMEGTVAPFDDVNPVESKRLYDGQAEKVGRFAA